MASVLGRAIDEADDLLRMGEDMRLRMPYCGIASFAVSDFLNSRGMHTRLRLSRPRLAFDHATTHVTVEVDTKDDDPIIVDATYSQFMGYVGLGLAPMFAPYYPERRIIEFRESQFHAPVDELLAATRLFRQALDRGEIVVNPFGSHLWEQSEEVVADQFARIWDPANSARFIPTPVVANLGKKISSQLKAEL